MGINEVISCLVIVLGSAWKFLGLTISRATHHSSQDTARTPKRPDADLEIQFNNIYLSNKPTHHNNQT